MDLLSLIVILLFIAAIWFIWLQNGQANNSESFLSGHGVVSGLTYNNQSRRCSDGFDMYGYPTNRTPYCENIGTVII